MKTSLIVFTLCAAALSLAACKSEEPAKPATPKVAPAAATTTTTTTTTSDEKSHGYEPGGMPGIADALKGDTKAEEKKDDAKPMPPAAPTPPPAEGAKK